MHRLASVLALAVLPLFAACGDGAPRTRFDDAAAQRPIGPSANEFDCPTRDPSLPTAIPTEQWTPEWLRGYSDMHMESHARRMDELQQQLVDARASFADVERRETMIDGWPEPVAAKDAAERADALIVGNVTAQYLDHAANDSSGSFLLISEIETSDGIARIAQHAYVGCVSDGPEQRAHIVLGKNPVRPLDHAARYAILVEREPDVHNAMRSVPGHTYALDDDGVITRKPVNVPGVDALTTLDDLVALYDDAR